MAKPVYGWLLHESYLVYACLLILSAAANNTIIIRPSRDKRRCVCHIQFLVCQIVTYAFCTYVGVRIAGEVDRERIPSRNCDRSKFFSPEMFSLSFGFARQLPLRP